MAISSTAVFQADNGSNGDDTNNAGYFNSPGSGAGTDYSITAPISCSDLAIQSGSSSQVSSSSIGFTSAHQRNGLRITGGSGFTTGLYEITSVSAGVATLDRSAGTVSSTGGTARVGGAFASPGGAFLFAVGSNTIYLKGTGTAYNLSNSSNVAGGKIQTPAGAASAGTIFVGYTSNRTLTNTDTRPVVQPSSNGMSCITMQGQSVVRNIEIDNGNSVTGAYGFNTGGNLYQVVESCKISGLQYGIYCGSQEVLILGCEVSIDTENNALGILSADYCTIEGCYIHGGTGTGVVGIQMGIATKISRSLITGMTGTSGIGISVSNRSTIRDSIVYNVAGTGLLATSTTQQGWSCINSVFHTCGAWAIDNNTTCDSVRIINCAGYNNTSGNVRYTTGLSVQGFIALTADPFNNVSGGDFSLNNSSSGGALLKAAGYPSALPVLSATNYADVGVYQHTSAGSTLVINRRRKVR